MNGPIRVTPERRSGGGVAGTPRLKSDLSRRPPMHLPSGPGAVRPPWLWAAAILGASGLHAGAIGILSIVRVEPPPAIETIELSVVAEGEPMTAETRQQDAAQAAAPQEEPAPSPPELPAPKSEPAASETDHPRTIAETPPPAVEPPPVESLPPATELAAEAAAQPPVPSVATPSPPEPAAPPPSEIPPPVVEPPPTDPLPPPSKPVEEALQVPSLPEPQAPQPVTPQLPPPEIAPPEPQSTAAPVIQSPLEQPVPRPPTPPVPPQSPKPQPSPAHPPIGHTIKPRPKHEPPKQVVPRPIAKAPTGEQPASEVHKTGVPEGKMVERGMTRETYAAIVNAEINAHRFYPESARAAGITGRVVVAFAIGASGTAAGITIVSSSGNAGLDDAARQAVRAVHAPPPPGGSFSASKTFSFSLH